MDMFSTEPWGPAVGLTKLFSPFPLTCDFSFFSPLFLSEMIFADDFLLDLDYVFGFSLILMEGEDGWHTPSPVELEYPTCPSEGKV